MRNFISLLLGAGQSAARGKFYPLNDSFWLRYEGRWGSIGTINSGPRGPVFQGFEDRGESNDSIYRAWYNNGANNSAANDVRSVAGAADHISRFLKAPRYTAASVTSFRDDAFIALSAVQTAIAGRFGTLFTSIGSIPTDRALRLHGVSARSRL